MIGDPGGLRRHLSYANVLATLTLFLVLGGGAAIAAGGLAKNSVGSRQLKRNAVTTAKIKKNAVTTAKLARGAIKSTKIKDASLRGNDLSPTLPFGHIAHTARGTGSVALSETGVVYPLDGSSFTQEAGEALFALGGLEFSVSPGCDQPAIFAVVIADQPDPLKAAEEISAFGGRGVIAVGNLETKAAGPFDGRLTLSPYSFSQPFGAAPASPVGHSLALVARAQCKGGGPGVTATFGGIDVIANGGV